MNSVYIFQIHGYPLINQNGLIISQEQLIYKYLAMRIFKGPLVISMKISPKRVEKYFFFFFFNFVSWYQNYE